MLSKKRVFLPRRVKMSQREKACEKLTRSSSFKATYSSTSRLQLQITTRCTNQGVISRDTSSIPRLLLCATPGWHLDSFSAAKRFLWPEEISGNCDARRRSEPFRRAYRTQGSDTDLSEREREQITKRHNSPDCKNPIPTLPTQGNLSWKPPTPTPLCLPRLC